MDRFLRLATSIILSKREGRGVMSMRALGWVDEELWGVRYGLLEDVAETERVRTGIFCALLR